MGSESNLNAWSTRSRHSVVESSSNTADPSVGSPPGPGLIVGSPPANEPLQNLHDMFPQINITTVHSIYQRSGQNPSVAAEMLLSLHHLSHSGDYRNFSESDLLPASRNGAHLDPFRGLPLESVKMIAKYLTLFELAAFGCVNHECKRLAEEELCTVTMLHNAGGMRHASDRQILSMLARFPRLTTVSLYKCANFQNFALLPIALRHSHITSLNLAFCAHLHDDDLRVVMKGLPLLQMLDLSGTDISDEGLETISVLGVDTLKRLVLSGCRGITDFGIAFVYARCSALSELDLRSTHIRPTALEPSPLGARLTKLFMSSCKRVSTIFFANEFETLTTLVLSSNPNMTSVHLDLPNLSILNLSSSKQLGRLVLNTPLLIVLNLSGCSRLSEAEFTVAVLTKANLYNCRSLPFSSIASLIRGCRINLQDIDLRGCPQLLDDDTANLVRICPNIARFDITGCKMLTAAGIGVISRIIQTAIERRSRS